MDKHTLWAWAIKNSICIICWVVLAIVFNKWWIALFAALFMSGVATKQMFYRTCDKCGKRSEYAESYNSALKRAQELGWLHIVEGNKDYCPDCQKQLGD